MNERHRDSMHKQTTYMYNPLSCSQNVNEVVRCVITERCLAPLSNKQTKPLSADIIYASSIWFESEHGSTRCYLMIQSSPKPGLIAAMNLFKKFIRSISHMCLNPNSKERARPGKIYKRSRQPEEAVENDKDLFSAMIKYLCWGIQVKLLFVFWFNEWFEQWQCWEAQMLGLLKPALMPIQGSVWSCVRLQQDQSRAMPLCGSQHRGVGW